METEVFKAVAEYGILAIIMFMGFRYFMQVVERKDKQLTDVMERSIKAIENNTSALKEIKDKI